MTWVPSEEQRGGDKPAWDQVVAGEPLPERQESVPPHEDYEQPELPLDLDLGDLPE